MSRWLDPAWREQALEWIEASLGGPPTGAVEQPHVFPWATALRVPTADGDVWFKAIAPAHRFEAALAPELARLVPGRVPEVLAADPRRGWLLLRDAGRQLRSLESWPEQRGHWERALPRYAELQLELAPRARELPALGVPVEPLAGVPGRLEELLEWDGVTDELSGDELARLRASAGELASLCRELAGYGVPETLQHDDLHDNHVCAAPDGYRFIDWGDSAVSHPFHSLVVTLRFLAWKHGLEPGGRDVLRLRDAYLEPFGGPALAPAAEIAYRTGRVARALAWHRFVTHPEPAVEPESRGTVAGWLLLYLAGGPIGTWDTAD